MTMRFLKAIVFSIMLICSSSSLAEAAEVGDTVIFTYYANGCTSPQNYELMRKFYEKKNIEAVVRMMNQNKVLPLKKDMIADIVGEGYYGEFYGYKIVMANGPYQNITLYVSEKTILDKTIIQK